jgi:prepilin-type N-terminal cleavage/methylation domain-containing protein
MRTRLARRAFTLVEVLVVVTIISLLAGILLPRFWAARDRAAYTACGQNLKNIATVLTTYANDNAQMFPPALSAIKAYATLPRCPEAEGVDTYSPSYQSATTPATFTVFCKGSYHVGTAGVGPNEPYYHYGLGLGP